MGRMTKALPRAVRGKVQSNLYQLPHSMDDDDEDPPQELLASMQDCIRRMALTTAVGCRWRCCCCCCCCFIRCCLAAVAIFRTTEEGRVMRTPSRSTYSTVSVSTLFHRRFSLSARSSSSRELRSSKKFSVGGIVLAGVFLSDGREERKKACVTVRGRVSG